jgi:hypothetical protein
VQAFSAGAVLSRSFAIWVRNLAPFLLLTLLITFPGHVLRWAVEVGRVSMGDPMLDQAVPQLVEFVLLTIVSGAICFGVFQDLRGKPVGFARCVAVGLTRLVPVMLVGLVTGVVIGIGAVVFIVPGLILACVLYVVVPAAVIEGSGVAGSMQRSAQLTLGHRWAIFAICVVTVLLNFAAALVAVLTLPVGSRGFWTARVGLAIVFGSFGAVTTAVAYYDLRQVKEGHAPEDVADVFD